MDGKVIYFVSFVSLVMLFGPVSRGGDNHNELQEESIIDPNLAYDPYPHDGVMHNETWAALSWSPGSHATSHDVYFGTKFEDVNNGTDYAFYGNQLEALFVIGFPGFTGCEGLVPGTTYYWRIDEVNDLHPDSPWKGEVWSFTIRPSTAFNPVPTDGAGFIDPNITLSWDAGFGAQSHTIYFGDNIIDVSSTFSVITQQTTYYNPDPLEPGKSYFWRVDESDWFFTYYGPIWGFNTKPSDPNIAHNPSPLDGAIYEKTWAVLSWSPGGHAVTHDVYFGDNFEDVNEGAGNVFLLNQVDTFLVIGFPSQLQIALIPGTTYYWRIDEVNDLHPDSPWKGDVWSFKTTEAESLSEALDSHLSFTTGGSANWFWQFITSCNEGDAAQSGKIFDYEDSRMQATVDGAGTISFYWKVSSEYVCDFLEFYIDGKLKAKISGSVDWQKKIYTITNYGLHTLEWRYAKDGCLNEGNDCGWVDQVEWINTP